MSGYKRLCSPAVGIAFGIVSGLSILLFAWAGWLWGYGTALTTQFAEAYIGYAPTFVGGLLGGLWGLVEGFIAGIIFAWIYNCIAYCCHCCKKDDDGSCP